jgi:hypothetical protein
MNNKISPRHRAARTATLVLTLLLAVLAWPGGDPAFAAFSRGQVAAPAASIEAAPPAAPVASIEAAPPVVPRVNVAIQVGHWKENELPDALARLRGPTGTSGGGRTEVSVNLDIAQRVAAQLRAAGRTVEILPATVPTGYEADLFIALHADGNSSGVARGYKVSTRWTSAVAALAATLVDSLDSAYGSVTGLPHDSSITRAMRGYYAYSTYRGEAYRLGGTTPAAIIEMGFMSNAADRAVMFNRPNTVAAGIVAGIERYYGALGTARRLQAQADQQAAASATHRAAVALYDGVNIRSAQSSGARRVAVADFGQSFPVLDLSRSTRPPSGSFDPRRGTTLASGAGWYNVAVSSATSGYISRDVVVVQQSQPNR